MGTKKAKFDKDEAIKVVQALWRLKIPTTFVNVAHELGMKVTQVFFEITEHYPYNFDWVEKTTKTPYISNVFPNELRNWRHPATRDAIFKGLENVVVVDEHSFYLSWFEDKDVPWLLPEKYKRFFKETGIEDRVKVATGYFSSDTLYGMHVGDLEKNREKAKEHGWEILTCDQLRGRIGEIVEKFVPSQV